MKVLVVHNAGPVQFPSGELVVANQEIAELRKRGIEATSHIVSNDDINSTFKAAVAGLSLLWSPTSFRAMTRVLKRARPDVVHVHTIVPLLTVSILSACKRLNIPVVQTVHHYRWFCVEGGFYDSSNNYCEECLERGQWRGVVKRCAKKSAVASGLLTLNNLIHVKSGNLTRLVDRFIAISRFVLDKHLEAGFPSEKMVLKYNGVYLESIKDEPVPAAERRGVTFAGRLVHARGVPILRGIIPLLRDVPITILGHGPFSDELREFCRAGGYDHVSMPGKVPSETVYETMSKAACVLVPTLHAEGFGLAAVEAMACRAPVVASSNGSLVEIVGGSGGGVNVEDNSPEKFAAAIRRIVGDTDAIKSMGETGRRYAETNFSMEHSIDSLVAIYNQVIAEGR